ncbi:MAG: hypothetical protein JRI23_25525 [Deltaproteobacteria bacterium]|nr:hypothetical protein [Deltaproteobacteria bacterium]MBW2535383.1 hypothetical protein [Deltaproteobacteria bacterium]
MSKLTLVTALAAGFLIGCGSPPPPTSPAEDPGLPEPEVVEPEPVEPEPVDAEPIDPDQEEMQISEPGADDSAPAEEAPPEEAPPARATCAELKKSRCKVTQGCAWRENQGKGECIDHVSDY